MNIGKLLENQYIKLINIKRTIFLVILFAGLIRLWGIWHGYPYSYYPDEAHFVKQVLSFGSGDLNPHWFHKPAFLMYLLFFEYGLFFLIGKLANLWNSVSDFAVFYVINPGPFYIIGRITVFLFGIATIWLVYRLCEKFFEKNSGIPAALILSVSFGHVVACQDVKADIPATFFAILSMYYLLDFIKNPNYKVLLKAAASAGIGAATKVYPIVMLGPICLAILFKVFPKGEGIVAKIYSALRYFVTAFFIFWLTYFICSPYSFIDPLGRKSVFGWIEILSAKASILFGGSGFEGPDKFFTQRVGHAYGLVDYFRVLMTNESMGLFAAGLGMVGCLYLLYKADKRFFVFLLYPALFIVSSVITFPGFAEARHQLPIYPFMAVAGGVMVTALTEKLKIDRKVAFVTFLIFLFWPTYLIFQRAVLISKPDTRNLAKAWVESHIPPGSKLLIDENGPQLLKSEKSIVSMLEKARKADNQGQFTAHYDTYLKYQLAAARISIAYEVYEIRFPWWRETEIEEGVHILNSDYDRNMGNPLKPVGVQDYEFYINNGFEYVIVHSDIYNLFVNDTNFSRNFPSFSGFYNELFKRAHLVKSFDAQNIGHPGPTVKIFSLAPEYPKD